MAAETERIELPGGQWWLIRTRLTRGMEKAITRASLAAVPQLRANGVPIDTPEAMTAALMSNVGAVDIGGIEDAYLLSGSVSYSFGETIDMATIDGIDASVIRSVLTRMYELYNPQRLSEEARKDFTVRPSQAT